MVSPDKLDGFAIDPYFGAVSENCLRRVRWLCDLSERQNILHLVTLKRATKLSGLQ
mgnify:CR=1 FL=1